MENVTRYFRNAILASQQDSIGYCHDKFITVTWEEIQSGRINSEDLEEVFLCKSEKGKKKDDGAKNIIIASKTIATEYSGGHPVKNSNNEMTSVYFIPAKVDENGILCYREGIYPWIPREYLLPMTEPELAVGEAGDYDEFLERYTDKKNQIDSWGKYVEYVTELYEYVTKSKFSDDYISNQKIKTDGKFYVFEDNRVNAAHHIEQFYNQILEDKFENRLYSKITNGVIEPVKPIPDRADSSRMKYHSGQMGGQYQLSNSQREAISCFSKLEEGDVLAVNGPPGTGKTTLLQSIVADMYVKAALDESDAPVIIATSTNNQAVTNIIDSFGSIKPIGIGNLEKRWIKGVYSFSVYFPSDGKKEEARNNKYQYTNQKGEDFFQDVESKENREQSKILFKDEFLKFFGKWSGCLDNNDDLYKHFQDNLHKELQKVESQRIECLNDIDKVKREIGSYTTGEYLLNLNDKIEEKEKHIQEKADKEHEYKSIGNKLKERNNEWRGLYNKLPWYVRIFKFVPAFKRKITVWSYNNMKYDELDFLERGMEIDEIEQIYLLKIKENDTNLQSTINERLLLETERDKYIDKRKHINDLIGKIAEDFSKFGDYKVDLGEQNLKIDVIIEKLNDSLDRVRYVEFWLAVHYYEAHWLSEECNITEKQKGKTYENVLNTMYKRLAMITPCMVMTCFMLPSIFYAYRGNDKKHFYMYDYADLLIVDEAGQITPEIGVPAFAFAKKAVVVGDENQIPPVWGIARGLDIAMAVDNNVITNADEYSRIEDNGLNCSGSSVMKIAALSCCYEKYGKGLFLSEHRRCYNEIIQYCNDLVYNGNLEPLRGRADDNDNVLKGYLPPMGHKQILSEYSDKIGTSRQNINEAKEIVQWLRKNYPVLCEKYSKYVTNKNEGYDKKTILGVITPFKSQSSIIKSMLKKELPEIERNIAVGTVHTFQGAERKVIIFSSVYGSKDGCYFINNNRSLMNVAVSRAKDSFLIFGDRGCLVGGHKSAAYMLKAATAEEIE